MSLYVNYITKQHVFTHCTLMHMTDSMTPIHAPQHHFRQNHNCFQAFSQHGAIRRGAFRHGTHGDPRLRQPEDRRRLVCRCRQRSAGCRGSARMATWRRAKSGDHAARRLACVSSVPCIFRPHLSNCEHHKTVLHGTIEFQPPCSPDLSRARDMARSVSNSCQSLRIAGTFDPRVSQNVGRQP